jgi:lipopolysaccharide export system permease protein
VISLLVLTFVWMIPPILQRAEQLIARGVELSVVARALLLLAPQALCLTLPMSVLFGILIGFGRLSADREFVTMQACGVSLLRLLRPVGLIALVATAATAYEIIVALPGSNQAFRVIVSDVIVQKLETELQPRVFFDRFPHRVIYVRDLPPEGGWRGVFVGDQSQAGYSVVYFAHEGRIRLDREKHLVQLQLTDGVSHKTSIVKQETYEPTEFKSISIWLDPETVFLPPPPRGTPEMTIAELRKSVAEEMAAGGPAYSQRFMIHYKFALPLMCPILAVIALALGASNHRGGKLTSFVFGFGVVLIQYVLLYAPRALAMGGRLKPELAPWIPNIVMGIGAVMLMAWRLRAGDQPIRIALPAFWRRRAARAIPASPTSPPPRGSGAVVVIRIPRLNLPSLKVLDMYISREYLRVFALGVAGLLAIFYISTFIDMMDKLFRGETTTATMLRYFMFETPQFVYYVIPMSALVATLVTVGVMTKNSELLVLRACGISLYRASVPLVFFGLAASGTLFFLQERVLASTNREADRLEAQIRGWPQPATTLTQHWRAGTSGAIYHFDFFDPDKQRFARLHLYDIDEEAWTLKSITYVNDAERVNSAWQGRHGWRREFGAVKPNGPAKPNSEDAPLRYEVITERDIPLEPPEYFLASVPFADQMTYAELRRYIAQLEASGANVVPYTVELRRKIAFPLVTVVMTLIALPFAVTTGGRGALYGVGVGIVLGIVYFVTMSIFVALGKGGLLEPTLAAWAPNMLFSAAAAYLILTVRT